MSFIRKLFVCLLAGSEVCITIIRIGRRMAFEWGLNAIFFSVLGALFLPVAVIYAIRWQRRDKRMSLNDGLSWTNCLAVMCYAIALDLSMIGFQKLFHLQFLVPRAALDQPFSSFSGESLTWAYFGYSYAFVVIIGLLQIVGSLLLVFNRTRLLGAFTLLPILINICLLDYFYHFETGELLHAVILLIGIVVLVFSEYDMLSALLIRAKSSRLSTARRTLFLKNGARFSVVYVPLLLIPFFHLPAHNDLTGKYTVERAIMNQENVYARSCADSALTVVYIEKNHDCVFEYNDQRKRLIGECRFGQNNLEVIWRYPAGLKDTLRASLTANGPNNRFLLSGKMGKDLLEVYLLKQP